jgi:hypothetical protein
MRTDFSNPELLHLHVSTTHYRPQSPIFSYWLDLIASTVKLDYYLGWDYNTVLQIAASTSIAFEQVFWDGP